MACLIVGIEGCKPDPCETAVRKTADFKMYEYNWLAHDTLLAVDTTSWQLLFRALHKADEHLWYIGTEAEPRTGEQIRIEFPFDKTMGRIRVMHIAKYTPDKTCFPNDDGIDTLIKYIHPVEYRLSPVWGTYVGCYDDCIQGEDTLEIRNFYIPSNGQYDLGISNFPKGCDSSLTDLMILGRWISTQTNKGSSIPSSYPDDCPRYFVYNMKGFVDPDNKIHIDYTTCDKLGTNFVKHTFTGRRIKWKQP